MSTPRTLRERLTRLRETLVARTDTVLTPIPEEKVTAFPDQFPDAPDDLVELFRVIGLADIANHGYILCFWTTTEGFYDPVTAAKLSNLIIAGRGSTGACEAYDSANEWQFGTITETCEWLPDDGTTPTLLDFLELTHANSN